MTEQKHENNKTFYDRISRAYDSIADSNEHRAREAGEVSLALMPGEHVLELGYGTGNSIINLADMVGPTGHAEGIDISEGMRKVAQEKIDNKGLSDRIDLRVGDARSLPFGDNSFDAAFASFTLELFPLEDIPTVLLELRRVLKPGGRLAIVSMATVRDSEKASILERTYIWMHQHFPHIVDCQPIDVSQLLADAQFEIKQELALEIWTMPVAVVVGVKG